MASRDQPRYQLIEPRGHQQSSTLGEGAYGVVYRARDNRTGEEVALKKIRLEREVDGISSSTVREITLLMHLNHPNVVKLLNVVMDRDRMSLIFELLDQDLKRFLDSTEGPLPLETIKSFTRQILSGVAHCHGMGIMHRDLKPHNILLNNQNELKIADFGLARSFSPFQRELTTEVITRWYRAPEVLLGQNSYSCGVDLWSVGCIVAELCTGQPFISGTADIDQLYKIFRIFGTPNDEMWPSVTRLPFFRHDFPAWPPLKLDVFLPMLPAEGIDFLLKMFEYDPAKRIRARAALEHPFLAETAVDEANVDPTQTPVSQHEAGSNLEDVPSNAQQQQEEVAEVEQPDAPEEQGGRVTRARKRRRN